MLIIFVYSKRISGFDMAPPASAMLAAGAAAAAAGTDTSHLLSVVISFNCYWFVFV